jgi:hypothetical protein
MSAPEKELGQKINGGFWILKDVVWPYTFHQLPSKNKAS